VRWWTVPATHTSLAMCLGADVRPHFSHHYVRYQTHIFFGYGRIPRYEEAKTALGFADLAAAEAWIEADKATHRPGPKRRREVLGQGAQPDERGDATV
jgi:hypothetical protein